MRRTADAAIGVFDSGIGGLTVVRALMARMPSESTVYLGDTARVPYGTKSAEVVTRYALANAAALMQHDIKLLVVACNTASAVAIPALRKALPLPVVGVIEPGAAAAAATTRTGKIAVIGTEGMVASGAYQAALEKWPRQIEVRARACPLFVPLAEEGWLEGEVPTLAARRYLSPDLLAGGVDTLVLGCTHYPLLKSVIRHVVGPDINLVDSGVAAAETAATVLNGEGLVRGADARPSRTYFVTDTPGRFIEVGARFLGEAIPRATQIDLAGATAP